MIQTAVLEAIGVLGFLLNFASLLMLARKDERAWGVRIGGNVIVLAYNISKLSFANIFGSTLFLGVNIYGLRRWRRERQHAA